MGQRVQRLAAYAVIVRGDRILLSRLAERVTKRELWSLPGGGVDHGEDPRDAVVREVYEETGLHAEVGETAHVYSLHVADSWRRGRRVDAHSVRIVYEGWVPADAPEPHVTEVDGSTAEAAWKPIAAVLDGSVPTVGLVTEALASYAVRQRQRTAAYAYVVRDDAILLTRTSDLAPDPGTWHLPGGGIDHGESPRDTIRRELWEECGLEGEAGDLLTVLDHHFTGTAPNGREEDFHAIGVIYHAEVGPGEPHVVEEDGTTDEAAWVPLADVAARRIKVYGSVRAAIEAAGDTVAG
ncbi:NUDIX domain-containing protein [Nocardioides nitrophenolicus]|uniref:NUDIX domain-containing protein n=1 Tax=Nocardioides nitrophenolicus TaxID=60489 RepID=UPI001EF801BE|nr:NUDIX domain-containing protein [Nocardioides nitrophenolicus]MBM7518396.1 ADP-ribose pyrophosphatase YjhB (NUDIX family) [Nocardioides nitrophenolicus]